MVYSAKKQAILEGNLTFYGNPCSKCGRKLRYTSNSHCFYCRSQRVKRTDIKCTTAICDEFSTKGSVFCVEHARISKMSIRAKEFGVVSSDNVWLWPDRLQMTGRECLYCGGFYENIDHVVPMGGDHKGPHDVFNLIPSCWDCNQFKGDRLPHECWPLVSTWSFYIVESVELFAPAFLEHYRSD